MSGKLRVNLDDLRVESFSTTPDPSPGSRGTVFGLSENTPVYECPCDVTETDPTTISCEQSCGTEGCQTDVGHTCNTCATNCGWTCDGSSECVGTCAYDTDCTQCGLTHICC